MALTKLTLYNDALILLGQRRLATDADTREERYDLDSLYDNGAVDYCLEMVKPRFATKLDQITGVAATLESSFTYQATLPTNFAALAEEADGMPAIYRDGRMESKIGRFAREDDGSGKYILSDVENIWVRYVQDFTTVGLTNMPFSFGRVVSAYLARELAWKYDPDAEERLQATLDARAELARGVELKNEPIKRGFAPDTLTADWLAVYNDALQGCLLVDPIVSLTDDSLNKNRLDLALDNGLVESVLEDNGWHFGMQTAQLFYDPSVDPAFGYTYACDVPADVHRVNGVWVDEYFKTPLTDYIDEEDPPGGQRRIFSSHQIIYIQYVSTDWITTPEYWPSYFRRLVAARMAVDANVPGGDKQYAVAQYDTRRREAKSTDAMNAPPRTLQQGSWSRTRNSPRGSDRNRP